MTISMILYTTSIFSSLLPFLTGLAKFRDLQREMRWLFLLLALATFFEISGYLLVQSHHHNVYWIFHVYSPIQFALLLYIYSFWLKGSQIGKYLLLLVPMYGLFSIINTVVITGLDKVNYMPISLSYTVYILVSSFALYRFQLFERDAKSILHDSQFWVSVALLISSTGSICYFAFYELVSRNLLVQIWEFHLAMNITANILYSIGFLCQGQRWEYSGDSLSHHLYY